MKKMEIVNIIRNTRPLDIDCELHKALSKGHSCGGISCSACRAETYGIIADAIEQSLEQSESSRLPEGIEWPRFEDGELVKFGDKLVTKSGSVDELDCIHFYDDELFLSITDSIKYGEPIKRPKPEVLDADGVPIKVGDTVYSERFGYWKGTVKSIHCAGEPLPFADTDIRPMMPFVVHDDGWDYGCDIVHYKADTQEAIDAEARRVANGELDPEIIHSLLERQRKLLTE